MKQIISRLAATLALSMIFMTSLPVISKANDMERRKFSLIYEEKHVFKSTNVDLSNVKNREIIVKTKEKADFLLKQFGVKQVDAPSILKNKGIFVVRVPKSLNYFSVLQKMENSSLIEFAEPNLIQERYGFTAPDDEFFPSQWYLPKIKVPYIWENFEPKNPAIKIAVLDTGVDYNHPDLIGQVLQGYDILDDDDNPMDTVGHGTAIAGIIAASANNSIGIAGINPYAKILPIRVGDSEGVYKSDSVAGIYYAIDNGAQIINLSYGSDQFSEAEYYALYEAYLKGIVIVAAAGNEGDEGKTVTYPAAYHYVISVGSTNQEDQVSYFTNLGNALDLIAPGEDIGTTIINESYDYVYGTSYAAPIVAGVVSLLMAKKKGLTPDEIEYLLQKGAKPLVKNSNNWSSQSGYGRIDADGMLSVNLPSLSSDYGDTRSKAKTISINKTYKNKYDLPGDNDWYKLKITKTMKLKVELSGVKNIDGMMWIDQYKGGKIIWEKYYNKAGMGKKDSFSIILKPGTYYFQIMDYHNHWSPLTYTFKVSKIK